MHSLDSLLLMISAGVLMFAVFKGIVLSMASRPEDEPHLTRAPTVTQTQEIPTYDSV